MKYNQEVKLFKNKKHAYKARKVYVYCPDSAIEQLSKVLDKIDVEFVINDYELKDFSYKVICHYQSNKLSLEQQNFLIVLTELGAWVEPLVSYLDVRRGYTEVELLSADYFIHQKAFSILSNKRTQIAKRFVDFVSALTLLIIAFPIGIITAILIKLDSKGPIFYKQKRVGLYNQEFEVIKFRSMSSNAEASGAQWAKKNDSRVTAVGRFIRKTRIDELPQVLNILKGEMSIVGPRPEREIFVSELEKEIPYYRFRHAVKPGVTGLAQVKYPYGASVEDAVWKHKYDIFYIKHHKAMLDFKILFRTVKVVIFGMGQ